MTHLVPFVAPGPPAIFMQRQPWHITNLIAFSLLAGLVVLLCFRCWCNRGKPIGTTDPVNLDESYPPLCASYPDPLPMSRLVNQEAVSLATFVTRRPNIWENHQLRGRDCFLVLD